MSENSFHTENTVRSISHNHTINRPCCVYILIIKHVKTLGRLLYFVTTVSLDTVWIRPKCQTIPYIQGSRVAQRSKALHLSARGVTTDPGRIPGCITTGRDWESHRVAQNWSSVVRVRVWPGGRLSL
jgi:hypothetical protein